MKKYAITFLDVSRPRPIGVTLFERGCNYQDAYIKAFSRLLDMYGFTYVNRFFYFPARAIGFTC